MIDQDELKKLLSYDAESGLFIWICPTSTNSRISVGSRAGSGASGGYRQIRLKGRLHLEHRLVWLYMFGEWPPRDIDHINGDPSDNRIANLRLATMSQNCANRKKLRTTSGVRGVYWHKRKRIWAARIGVNRKTIHIGYFLDLGAAEAARKAAADEHFGEFMSH